MVTLGWSKKKEKRTPPQIIADQGRVWLFCVFTSRRLWPTGEMQQENIFLSLVHAGIFLYQIYILGCSIDVLFVWDLKMGFSFHLVWNICLYSQFTPDAAAFRLQSVRVCSHRMWMRRHSNSSSSQKILLFEFLQPDNEKMTAESSRTERRLVEAWKTLRPFFFPFLSDNMWSHQSNLHTAVMKKSW